MRIFVCPRDLVYDQKEKGITHIVSILDPGKPLEMPTWFKGELLRLEFYDIKVRTSNMTMPKMSHIKQILKFGKSMPPDATVLCHCFAGISRSAAAALALACQETKDVAQGMSIMTKACRWAWPNDLMVSFIDKALDFKGELIAAVEKYKYWESRSGGVVF